MKHLIKLMIVFGWIMVWGSSFFLGQVITVQDLEEKGILLERIGENNEILCVINTGTEDGSYWFILEGIGQNRQPGSNLAAFLQVSQLLASPDKKYLGVLSVGEGHPIVEVIDLQELRTNGKYNVLHSLNPYPGIISMEKWEGKQLVLLSNIPLTLMKKDEPLDAVLLLPEEEKFSLDAETGTVVSIGFDVQKLIAYHVANLVSEDKWKKIEAANALKILEAKDAAAEIKKALAKESDKDVIAAFSDAIDLLKGKTKQ